MWLLIDVKKVKRLRLAPVMGRENRLVVARHDLLRRVRDERPRAEAEGGDEGSAFRRGQAAVLRVTRRGCDTRECRARG